MDRLHLSGQSETVRRPDITLMSGLIVMTLCLIAFGVLGYSVVTYGPLNGQQTALLSSIHQQALKDPHWVVTLMLVLANLGQYLIIGLALLLGLYWLFLKMWRELVMLTIGVAGGAGLFLLTANLIDRHRPIFQQPLHPISFPGFPSGHLVSSMTFYSLLVYLFMLKTKSPFWRAMIISGFFFLIGVISYTRLFLGDHYLTDVLAGFAIGLAWSALVYPSVDWVVAYIHQKKSTRQNRTGVSQHETIKS